MEIGNLPRGDGHHGMALSASLATEMAWPVIINKLIISSQRAVLRLFSLGKFQTHHQRHHIWRGLLRAQTIACLPGHSGWSWPSDPLDLSLVAITHQVNVSHKLF